MTRSFDVFGRDGFRAPDYGSERGMGSGSDSFWSTRVQLHEIYRKEERADALDRETRARSRRDLPPTRREERVREVLEQRTRTAFLNRNRTYRLRNSEIYAMSEVGRFRIVANKDLAEFAYNGDRSRMENDVENLVRQGLVNVQVVADTEYNPRQIVTLTKEAHKLLSRGKVFPRSQAIYHGLKKPKETNHDADLYRLFHKVSDEIESRGGRVVGVRLDYELKADLYSRIATAAKSSDKSQDAVREEIAERYHLKVVDGKIPIPDLRIEYVNEHDGQIHRRDLELTTDHYRPQGLSEKARAGFQIYARPEDTSRLRRVRDREELMTAIFSL